MKKLNVIYGALLFVLMMMCCSCGARKSNVEKSKEEIHTESVDNSITESKTDSNIKTTNTVKTDDKNQTVTEETILEPADTSKESFVIEKDGTKVILNNAKKIVRKTTQSNNTKSEIVNNIDELKKESVKEQKAVTNTITSKKEIKSKQIERKATPWYYWLLLLIPIGIIYWAYRKYIKF